MHVAYNSHGNLMIFLSLSLTIWFLVTHPFLLFCISCPVYELVISILVVICHNGVLKKLSWVPHLLPFHCILHAFCSCMWMCSLHAIFISRDFGLMNFGCIHLYTRYFHKSNYSQVFWTVEPGDCNWPC
jgi:hypothetical protein